MRLPFGFCLRGQKRAPRHHLAVSLAIIKQREGYFSSSLSSEEKLLHEMTRDLGRLLFRVGFAAGVQRKSLTPLSKLNF